MGYIEVYTENTDGSWNYRGWVNMPSNYTFPGNQYGSTQTHEWIFVEWIGDNGDQEEKGYDAIAGVANDQVIGLNQTITLNKSWPAYGQDWDNIYTYLKLYFRIHNLRTIINTITYNGNGSDGGSTDSNTATYGSNYTFQANGFTKTGYTFFRWALNINGNFIGYYNQEQSYGIWTMTSSNVIVYAKWTAKTYTITYDANGGSGTLATNPQTATYDSSFTFQAANGFTRTGYAFSGWWLYESNGITRINSTSTYASGQLYGTWNIDRDVIAKAQWNTNSYTVTFDRNGKGTGKTVTQSVGTTVTCPILKAVGYVFGGWATSASSTTVNKEGNATFVLGTANQSFFAIWTENTNGSVSFSELQTVYTGTHPIGISEYRTQSGQTTANSQITLSANFKGKGPAP